MGKQSSKPALGRPVGGNSEKVRAQLLDAARELFLSYEFKSVSISKIAEKAGVNGAMVRYYFGDKKGLYLAMVEEVIGPIEQSLQALGAQGNQTLEGFIKGYSELLVANPWWPNFIIREVIFGEDEIRSLITEKFSSVTAPALTQDIQKGIKSGKYRPDLNPQFALLSLLGMTVFPFLAKPIIEKVMGLSIDRKNIDSLTAHTSKMFLQGVTGQPEQDSNHD